MSNNLDYKLVWKYFFEQKLDEIGKLLGSIILLPFVIMDFIYINIIELLKCWWNNCYTDLEDVTTTLGATGILLSLISLFIGLVISDFNELNGIIKYNSYPILITSVTFVSLIIVSIIFYWVQINWEQAKKRARRDGRKRK